jgi:hypothetical protein
MIGSVFVLFREDSKALPRLLAGLLMQGCSAGSLMNSHRITVSTTVPR